MSCQSAKFTMVKANCIKAKALLKYGLCYCAHFTYCRFVVFVGIAHYPVRDALASDILHRNKVPSLSFKMRAYSDAVCYFEKMCLFFHCISVCICSSYLECTNF